MTIVSIRYVLQAVLFLAVDNGFSFLVVVIMTISVMNAAYSWIVKALNKKDMGNHPLSQNLLC